MKTKFAADLHKTDTDKSKFLRLSPLTWAIAITLVFGAFQLPFGSFMADDFIQIGILEGVSPAKWLGSMEICFSSARIQ